MRETERSQGEKGFMREEEEWQVVQLQFRNSFVWRIWYEWLRGDDGEAVAENASGAD